MDIEYYKTLLKKYSEANIPTYTDLILGLPGENLESFKTGIDELLEYGQHTSLFVHLCEWLPLAEMGNKNYMDKYKIGFTVVPLNQPHRSASSKDDITEYSRIITSTYSMSEDEWKAMLMFSTCVLCFHHLGLLQFIALYLHHSKGVKYSNFYSNLLNYILQNESEFEVFKIIKERIDKVITENGSVVIFDDTFGDVAWPFEEYAFLKTVQSKDKFYKKIEKFLTEYLPDEVSLRKELIEYQAFVVKDIDAKHKNFSGSYDWKTYFDQLLIGNSDVQLSPKSVKYCIFDENAVQSWSEYATKILWFGRRGGKNIYTAEIKEKNDK